MRLPCLIVSVSIAGLASIMTGTNGLIAFPGKIAHLAGMVAGRRVAAPSPEAMLAEGPLRDAYAMVEDHIARPVTLTELGVHSSMVQVPSMFSSPRQIRIPPPQPEIAGMPPPRTGSSAGRP